MENEENERNVAITHVYAFKSGSIDTSYMAGENLERKEIIYPFSWRELSCGMKSIVVEIKKDLFFKKNIEEKFSD